MGHHPTHLLPRGWFGRLAVSGMLLSAGALAAACSAGGAEQDRPPRAEVGAAPVRVVRARLERVARPLIYSGSLEPAARVTVASKLLARVEEILIDTGQRVQGGQRLVRLDARDLDAALARAEAAVRMAEVELANAERQFARLERLKQRGSATERASEEAEAAYRLAQARLDEARAALAAAQVQREYAEIRAPRSGWVVERRVEAGDMVAPGAPLLVLEDIHELKLVFDVPGSQLPWIELGQPVAVEVAGRPPLAARIHRIVPSADRATRTARVEARLPNPQEALEPGLFARAHVEGPRDATLRVPVAALVREGDLTGVYVVDAANRARLRWLRVGSKSGDLVEVLSGLEANERYVLDPTSNLNDGTPVEVIEEHDGLGRGSRG